MKNTKDSSMSQTMTARTELRLPDPMKAQLTKLAEMQGLALPAYIRSLLEQAIPQEEQRLLQYKMNYEAALRFANSLEHPEQPNERLKAAFQRYKESGQQDEF